LVLKPKTLICIVGVWVALTIINYYFVPYFLVALEWLAMSLVLFMGAVFQLFKAIRERRALSEARVASVVTMTVLFLLTLYRHPVNRLLETADWHIFYSKRCSIVELVKQNKLFPNSNLENGICELPYEFPVLSNGGNDILIFYSNSTKNVSVTFWVFRNFFSAPSTHFVYTDDPDEIIEIEKLIRNNPEQNWKIKENWYRTFHD
jgi:hypothetical protein